MPLIETLYVVETLYAICNIWTLRMNGPLWREMGGVHEIFRAHSVGVAAMQSLDESHGTPVGLAHPLNPAPSRRNCVALDTLDQVGSLASVSGYCFGRANKCSVASWANC